MSDPFGSLICLEFEQCAEDIGVAISRLLFFRDRCVPHRSVWADLQKQAQRTSSSGFIAIGEDRYTTTRLHHLYRRACLLFATACPHQGYALTESALVKPPDGRE